MRNPSKVRDDASSSLGSVGHLAVVGCLIFRARYSPCFHCFDWSAVVLSLCLGLGVILGFVLSTMLP